jgi:hypothetical protein
MTNRRVLRCLLLVVRDLPIFDHDAQVWCANHNLIRAFCDGNPFIYHALTVTGENLLNNTIQVSGYTAGELTSAIDSDMGNIPKELLKKAIQHFGAMLRKFHQSGQLKADTNGKEEDNDNTNQQARDGKQRSSAEEGNQKRVKGTRRPRAKKCPF